MDIPPLGDPLCCFFVLFCFKEKIERRKRKYQSNSSSYNAVPKWDYVRIAKNCTLSPTHKGYLYNHFKLIKILYICNLTIR